MDVILADKEKNGEGGIRTRGTSVHSYDGLAKRDPPSPILCPAKSLHHSLYTKLLTGCILYPNGTPKERYLMLHIKDSGNGSMTLAAQGNPPAHINYARL